MWPLTKTPIAAEERRRLRWVILLLLLSISLPYAWSLAISPTGFVYQGLLYNADDQNVHLSWARQAAEGHFFFRDLFTHETLTSAERPLFTNLFAWIIGVLSRITHLPLVLIYHMLRLVFAALALAWFYALCALVTEDQRVRLAATVLAAFSGGSGWLTWVWPQLRESRIFIDDPAGSLMMPEAWTFASAFIFSLNIVSIALLVLIYVLVLRAQESGAWRYAFGAGAAALVLGNIHTYDVLPLNVTLVIWAALCFFQARRDELEAPQQRMAWLAPLVVIASTLPPLIYQYFVFLNSREFQIKALTRTAPPPLFDVLLSYSPLLVLALLGAYALRHNHRARLMMLWVGVTLVLIYAPVSFGRKMIEGAHLPLCFLAAAGLVWLVTRIESSTMRRAAAVAVIIVCSISSLRFGWWCLENAQENNALRAGALMPPLYLTQGDAGVLEYLRQSSQNRDYAVLSLPYLGNYTPRETGRVTFAGHWAETLNFFDPATKQGKIIEVQKFYGLGGRMTPEEARAWLQKNRIGFVVVGFYERLNNASLPLDLPVLWSSPDVNSVPGTTIYDARIP